MEIEKLRSMIRASMANTRYTNDKYGRVREDGTLECGPFLLGNKSGCTKEEYKAAEWYPTNRNYRPVCPPGKRLVANGKWHVEDEECRRVFLVEDIPPSPIVIDKAKVAAIVDAMGKSAEFFAWINSKASYATGWFNGDTTIVYDPADNASDLAALIVALGVPAEQVPSLIEKVRQGPEVAEGSTRNDPEPTEEELRETFGEDYDDAVRS